MKKASAVVAQFFVMTGLCLARVFGGEDSDCRLPSNFGVSADIPEVILDVPPSGFGRIVAYELDKATYLRFSLWRHFDMFGYDRDLPDFASWESRAVVWDALTGSLEQYFVVDPDTNLLFVYKTIGALVQDNDLAVGSVNFGVRRIVEGDPYAFVGHRFVVSDEEILELQIRACLRDWQYVVPEFVLTVPISTWTLGAGARYEVDGSPSLKVLNIEDSYYHNGSLEGGLSYFLGMQGPFAGGHLFLGTGYPEPLTVFFNRRF
jgi:hypothetical protein